MGGECLDKKIAYDHALLNSDLEEKNYWDIVAKRDIAKESLQNLEQEEALILQGTVYGNAQFYAEVEAAIETATKLVDAIEPKYQEEKAALKNCIEKEIAAHAAYVDCCNKVKSGSSPGNEGGDEGGDDDVGCGDGDDSGLEGEIEELIAEVEADLEAILEFLKQALDGLGADDQSTANDIVLIG